MKLRVMTDRRGFTILEVVIASAILGIGIVAMMGMQVAFLNGSRAARDNQIATAIANTIAEQLKTEGTSWTRNRPLTSDAHPSLKAMTDNPGAYQHVYQGHPVNPDLMPLIDNHPKLVDADLVRERALIGARYCIDKQARFLEGSDRTVIVGQVRVSWPSDGTSPWLETGGRCTNQGDNLDSFLVENNNLRPGRRSVMVPFAVMQNIYPAEPQ
jgi:prepilin-type N-terminal cleavage/methylation domain-containing protein